MSTPFYGNKNESPALELLYLFAGRINDTQVHYFPGQYKTYFQSKPSYEINVVKYHSMKRKAVVVKPTTTTIAAVPVTVSKTETVNSSHCNFQKTKQCKFFMSGNCSFGLQCKFAHASSDKRGNNQKVEKRKQDRISNVK